MAKGFQNVIDVLKSAITGKGVSVNRDIVKNPTVANVLEKAASNPFTTAGVIATAINPAGAIKAVTTAAKSIAPKSTIGKVTLAAATPVAVGAAIQNPVKTASSIATAPSSLASFGSNVSNLVANPSVSNLTKIYKDNPVIAGGLTAAGVVGLGAAATGIANTLSTRANTAALNKSTSATLNPGISAGVVYPDVNAPPVTYSAPSGNASTPVDSSALVAKTMQPVNKVTQKVQVLVNSQNRKTYKRQAALIYV